MEKRYPDMLTEYRAGEPGMPPHFIEALPPFNPRLSKQTIERVVEMRDVQKTSFIEIAKELRMTQAKAKHTYNLFYLKQALTLVKALQDKAESREEKDALWDHYFDGYTTSKKRYDMLINDISHLQAIKP